MNSARQLVAQASRTGNHAQSLALLLEAEQLATDDETLLFEIRLGICLHGVFAGQPDVLLLSFARCLKSFDQNPNFAKYENTLLWRYKYALANLHHFPNVSLQQFQTSLLDFRNRLQRGDYSLRTAIYLDSKVAMLCGDLDRAKELSREWTLLRRDDVSDCHACEVDAEARIFAAAEEWDACLEKAARLLSGRLKCAEVPHITYPAIARSHFYLGRVDEARAIMRKFGPITEGNPAFLGATAQQIELHVLMGEREAALTLLERRLPWLDQSHEIQNQYHFLAAGALLLDRALRDNADFPVRVSPSFLEKNNLPDSRAGTLLNCFQSRADQLGAAFDRRNGNTFWGDYYRRLKAAAS